MRAPCTPTRDSLIDTGQQNTGLHTPVSAVDITIVWVAFGDVSYIYGMVSLNDHLLRSNFCQEMLCEREHLSIPY